MSFLAKLTIDDKEYNVLSFSFEINQQVHPGRSIPSGMPVINHLHLTIEADSDDSFFAWSISTGSPKDGEIIFYKRDAMASSRKLNFQGAFCVNYTEKFESNSPNPMIMGLTLTARVLTLNDSVEYEDSGNHGF